MAMRWVEISVRVSPMAAEAVATILLEARTGGVVEEIPSPGEVLLKAYLPLGPATEVTLGTIAKRISALPGFGLDLGKGELSTREIDEEDWAHGWKAYFHTLKIGRLVIKPTWESYAPSPTEVVVELDPGMAFGTGLHPSTRLCLEFLERTPLEGRVVFDIGTGSGILAIAAAKLGAARVVAVDNDPIAVEVATRNVAHNRLIDRITVRHGEGWNAVDGTAHLIVANITAKVIRELLPHVNEHLEPSGRFVASGIVAGEIPGVLREALARNLQPVEIREEEEWRCIVLTPAGAR
ncbi:MAG: 50S ribosomal protein L11 methyltransferase [Armatimonadota bacterium]|nr:50S ribosomal protein L11 methyltransferase [Armatimonadota bacterium]MDR5702145.1 50S ribosomal protein L11 methyltransferase [Armatimonadota bacterium]